jgi:hypothetical protein
MNKALFAGLAICLLAAAPLAAQEPVKVVADFSRRGDASEAMFGAFGPTNETGNVCKESVQPVDRIGAQGGSLRLDYDVTSDGAYNGFWMKLGPDGRSAFDVSSYKNLSFWIKGDEKAGIPYKLKVELKSKAGAPAKKYIGGIGPDWKKIQIPLEDLAGQGLDLGKVCEFVIVFEQKFASPTTSGAIYIDEIAFEK